jgi:hypothetical protein
MGQTCWSAGAGAQTQGAVIAVVKEKASKQKGPRAPTQAPEPRVPQARAASKAGAPRGGRCMSARDIWSVAAWPLLLKTRKLECRGSLAYKKMFLALCCAGCQG